MILNDVQIAQRAEQGMIAPFIPKLIREIEGFRKISYGSSGHGYDIRLSDKEFYIFPKRNFFQKISRSLRLLPREEPVDPKNFSRDQLIEVKLQEDDRGQYFVLPAHTYALGVAIEKIELPPNIIAICIGKSTYARCGIICNLTPAEAGWRGHLTLEISNSSDSDCRIYANEGIAQMLFLEGEVCETCYETRSGKYQDQPEQVVFAKI